MTERKLPYGTMPAPLNQDVIGDVALTPRQLTTLSGFANTATVILNSGTLTRGQLAQVFRLLAQVVGGEDGSD